ncbi:MAG: aminodeoxychorismate synthase component I [Verrucomicrobia bacterium]|nr:aminodeoxychorismate synthase component I [Verrucomicrobiota bacterium]
MAEFLDIPEMRLTPAEVAARCCHLPGMVFFDTARDCVNSDAVSIVAASPAFVTIGRTDADWTALRDAVGARQGAADPQGNVPRGFAAGWVEYDGAFCFGFYDRLLAYRHAEGRWVSVGGAYAEWADMLAAGDEAGASQTFAVPSWSLGTRGFVPTMQRGDFLRSVERAQEYIAAGDIYQVNLSHRFTAPWSSGEPFAFYEALRRASPAPHAAFLALHGRSVLSSSPELFLRISGRHILTRPIKGTRPRRPDPAADAASAEELVASPKEIAELIMITDLERNDLGQVCEFGSVTATELLKLERFEQVFHLVSSVEGRLRPEIDPVTALRACFPGGSITGAPKKRAMEIIAELEPEPRGLYTGAIGYFGFNGTSQFNIAIRTVVIEDGTAHFHVGAGIVADSQPECEWQETLDKAAGILLAAQG